MELKPITSFSQDSGPDAIELAEPASPATAAKTQPFLQPSTSAKSGLTTASPLSTVASRSRSPSNVAVAVYEEVEEDVGPSEDPEAALEVVVPPRTITTGTEEEEEEGDKRERKEKDCCPGRKSKKQYVKGSVACEKGYSYSVVVENTSSVYPEKVVDYYVQIVPSDEANNADGDNADDHEDTAEERKAKIDDLLHFVNEIMNQDNVARVVKRNADGSKR